jgi:hypothetical protein
VGDICWVREIEFQHPSFIEKQDEKKSVFLPAYADDPTITRETVKRRWGRGKDKQKKTRQRIVFHMAIRMI